MKMLVGIAYVKPPTGYSRQRRAASQSSYEMPFEESSASNVTRVRTNIKYATEEHSCGVRPKVTRRKMGNTEISTKIMFRVVGETECSGDKDGMRATESHNEYA